MKRIWLKVEGVKLHSLRHVRDERKAAWATLQLGEALHIDGILLESVGGTDWFRQNWALATARILDLPWMHGGRKTEPLLAHILGEAVMEICHERDEECDEEDIRTFLEEGTQFEEILEEPENLPFFKPKSWKGLCLRIPVDFIRLKSFYYYSENDEIRTNIQIGHHLIFWKVKVFSKVFSGGVGNDCFLLDNKDIIDDALINLIQGILLRSDFQKTVRFLYQSELDDLGDNEFIVAVSDCRVDGLPPAVRFY